MKLSPPPGHKRVADWLGKQVRLLRDVETGLMAIPAGTVLEVTNVSPGLHLRGAPCTCCGVSMFVRRVSHTDVRVLSSALEPAETASAAPA